MGRDLLFWSQRRVMFMTKENLALLLGAIAIVEGTLQLLVAFMGIVAGMAVIAFALGILTGVLITNYRHARHDYE
jgi:ABC-type phosphate transport system permease subunit